MKYRRKTEPQNNDKNKWYTSDNLTFEIVDSEYDDEGVNKYEVRIFNGVIESDTEVITVDANNSFDSDANINNVTELKAGDYIYYENAKGDMEKCVVLYGKDDTESIQVMQLDLIPVNTTETSWNGVIYDIANSANSYINPLFSTKARIVGTPNNFSTDEYFAKYTKWKQHNEDNFYGSFYWESFYGDYLDFYENGYYDTYKDWEAMGEEKISPEGKYLYPTRQIRSSGAGGQVSNRKSYI